LKPIKKKKQSVNPTTDLQKKLKLLFPKK